MRKVSTKFRTSVAFMRCFHNTTLLKEILGFARDIDRVRTSHTCRTIREIVLPLIPVSSEFRTISTPKILPSMYFFNGDAYTIVFPHSATNQAFLVANAAQLDLENRGVSVLKWALTKCNKVGQGMWSSVRSDNVFMSRYLCLGDKILSRCHKDVLAERFQNNFDDCLVLHNPTDWVKIQEALMTNYSIRRYILSSDGTTAQCFANVFDTLSKKVLQNEGNRSALEYLDIAGPLTQQSIDRFFQIGFAIQGLALRRMPSTDAWDILGNILSRANDSNLSMLYLENIEAGVELENSICNAVEHLFITHLTINTCKLPNNCITRLLSICAGSMIEKLEFRKCRASAAEILHTLFLPTIPGSRIHTLVINHMPIPKIAHSTLHNCISRSTTLFKLDLSSTKLGDDCMAAIVDAIGFSSLQDLNLSWNPVNEYAHGIFANVSAQKVMTRLILDNCTLCPHSKHDMESLLTGYANEGLSITISTKNSFGVELGIHSF